jgi:ABC-type branched-subunit amino acid transport system substrate-binding protein
MSDQDVYSRAADPIPIGVLSDMPPVIREPAMRIYQLAIDDLAASGRFERGVELVERRVTGAPSGHIANAVLGFEELVRANVLAVIGPNHSDNNAAVARAADRARVPTVTLGAAAEHLSEYAFSIQWGSIPEDAYIVCNWLERNGHHRVTMTWDNAWHAGEYVRHFRNATRRAGIRILGDERLPQIAGDALAARCRETAREHRRLDPDAIVHFGTSASAGAWARAVHESGWEVPRIMNGSFFGVVHRESPEIWEGWVGTGLWDDQNETLASLVRRYAERYGEPLVPEMGAIFWDGIRALLEGLVLAPILTPEGVRRGLEDVKMLPAACGGRRNVLGFGPWDRRGIKGMDVMILRRMQGGKLVMEGRFEPMQDGGAA